MGPAATRNTTARTTTSAGSSWSPTLPRTDVPIWVGGRTRRSLRRAIELGDGWTPFALSLEEAGEMLAWGMSSPSGNGATVHST